ncbi:hypothetical protein ABEX78_32150 [Priestia megaterium]
MKYRIIEIQKNALQEVLEQELKAGAKNVRKIIMLSAEIARLEQRLEKLPRPSFNSDGWELEDEKEDLYYEE